jgi:hypothetical protein
VITKQELPNIPQELIELLNSPNEIPPVETWQPTRVGEVDIRIARNGNWLYQNERMEREATVQLFARILVLEANDYFLVTPVEKMKITVDAFPFVIRMMHVEGDGVTQRVVLSTNVGDTFVLGAEHPIAFEGTESSPVPTVLVRRNLKALISRQVYYELAEYMVPRVAMTSDETSSAELYGLWSNGHFFEL